MEQLSSLFLVPGLRCACWASIGPGGVARLGPRGTSFAHHARKRWVFRVELRGIFLFSAVGGLRAGALRHGRHSKVLSAQGSEGLSDSWVRLPHLILRTNR